MFVEESSTEVVFVEEEIKVLGLSLQKSGLPISFDSLGKLWEKYGEEYRGKILDASNPVTEIAICLNKVPDYISGCAVNAFSTEDKNLVFYIIPKGKYIKDSFNAESFEKLTNEALGKRKVKAWAKKNNVKINSEFSIEVYCSNFANIPQDNNWKMYTLTPVKDV